MVNLDMNSIKISNKHVGGNNPTFIIAEAGVNHNGKISLAKKLVDVAVNAGADAVKFQTFKSEGVVSAGVDSANYANKNIGKNVKQLDMIKSLELSYKDFEKLKSYCDKKKIIFLSTPHSFDAIDFLDDLVPAYKFGSGDITNIPALKHAAKKGKPMILGTGMSTLDEVKYAIKTIKSVGNNKVIALHCTTNYPCPINEVNLNAMLTMKKELDCLVGYSDHTLGILIPIIAATLGAVVIEKHFTIDKTLKGPDHKASLESDELKQMIYQIKNLEKVMGDYNKKPTESEKKMMKYVRKSIISKKDIKKNSIIKHDDLIIKRPGTGINPKYYEEIIWKKALKNIKKDTILSLEMLGD